MDKLLCHLMMQPSRSSSLNSEDHTSLRMSTSSEWKHSLPTLLRLMLSTPTLTTRPSTVSTNSLTGLLRRNKLFSVSLLPQRRTTLRSGTQLRHLLEIRTGEDQDMRHQSRTKPHVDHVGHSEPTKPSNQDMLSLTERTIFMTYPNRNLLTALLLTETTDAPEDGCTLLTNTFKLREESLKRKITHTRPRITPVKLFPLE